MNGLKTLIIEDKSSFSIEEKQQLRLSLNDVKLLIQTNFNTTQEQQELINNRIDYLIEAVARLNKFDWKSILVSSVLAIIIALSLDIERGTQLWHLFQTALQIIPSLQNN